MLIYGVSPIKSIMKTIRDVNFLYKYELIKNHALKDINPLLTMREYMSIIDKE